MKNMTAFSKMLEDGLNPPAWLVTDSQKST